MESFNSSISTKEALATFYQKNNFSEDGGANEKLAWIKFGFFSLPIPNLEARRKNIYLHDVSHIVTGYDTNWKGESAVSAWEVASGGWRNQYFAWGLTLWAMGLGVLFYPRHVLQGFRKGLTMNNGLTCDLSKEELFKLSVAELRDRLSIKEKRTKNPYLWMTISFFVFLFPFIIGSTFLVSFIHFLI